MNIWEKMVFRWATFLFKGRGRRDSCWIWGELPKHCRLQSCFDIVVSKTTWECVCGSVLTGWRIGGRTLQTEGGLGQSHGTPSSWRLTGSWEGDTDPWKWNTPWAISAHLLTSLVITHSDTAVQGSLLEQVMLHKFWSQGWDPKYSFWWTQLRYPLPPLNGFCVMICAYGNSKLSTVSFEMLALKSKSWMYLKSRISSFLKKRK